MRARLVRKGEPSAPPEGKSAITGFRVSAYKIPTSSPESDGTLEWNATTLVAVHIASGAAEGFGYTYASRASAVLIDDMLGEILTGMNALDIPSCHRNMVAAVRNLGLSGIAACAISALDNALWDLKAKLLNQPIIHLLGAERNVVPVYGSGGFCTYGPDEIRKQIESWRAQGIWQFKIKIGRDMKRDHERIDAAAKALPKDGKLFVDGNGAYYPRKALKMADFMKEYGVAWFEEPVVSDDPEGMRLVRDRAPPGMDISAGEYGFELGHFQTLLKAGAVDVLQADATRCLGVTGFLKASALAATHHTPLSSHCAPSLHTSLMAHVPDGLHIEYFWDHARIENMLFEGAPQMQDGFLAPQTKQPGFGLTLKTHDAEKYAL